MNTARWVLGTVLVVGCGGCAHREGTATAADSPAAPAVAAASRPSDGEFAQRLVGAWQEVDATTGQVSLETRYAADGTLTGWFLNHEKTSDGAPTTVKVTVHAKWAVADGKIRVTSCITDPSDRLPASYAAADLVSVDANELVFRSVEDGTVYHRRKVAAGRG